MTGGSALKGDNEVRRNDSQTSNEKYDTRMRKVYI